MRRLCLLLLLGLALPAYSHAQNPNRPDQRKKKRKKGAKKAKKAVKKTTRRTAKTNTRRRRARKPAPRRNAGPFAKGRSRFSLSGGSTGQFGNSYIVIGGGYGYFLADGFELGLDAAFYFGDDPSISVVSPNVRYVVWQAGTVKPYIGAFAQRMFLGEVNGVDLDDIDSVGARGGVLWATGRSFLTFGVAYSQILDCDAHTNVALECEQIIPEFGFGLSL